MTARQAQLTQFTSDTPRTLGKTFKVSADGTINKTVAGQMVAGSYTVKTVSTAADLVALLKSVGTDQAISSSLPVSGKPSGHVVTEKALPNHPGAVARSKRFFHLPAGHPGVICFDADAPKDGPPLTREALWQSLLEACPAIADAGVVWWPSGSSCIYEGDNSERRGISGQHFYVLTADLGDLARFGRAITARLWLAGHGSITVSSSGALLPRTVFDEAVHQPARLLFAGGAVCTSPLSQRRGEPVILADRGLLDTRAALPELTADEEGRYVALVASAKAAAAPRASAARQAWRSAREQQALSKAITAGEDMQATQERVGKLLDAALGGTLLGSFPLVLVDDNGNEVATTVDAVLKDRQRFHLARCLDPLSPDHRDRAPDAILYLNQPQPVVYSLDDGGTVFRLQAQPVRLAIATGDKARLAEQIAEHLSHEPDLFNAAGKAVRATGGDFAPMSRPMLQYRVGCAVSLYRKTKEGKESPADADQPTLDMVAALLPERLRKIAGKSTLPLIDSAGRITQSPGFDTQSGIFLDLLPDAVEPIPTAPSHAEVIEALRRLWHPWSAYHWCTSHNRAAVLATVLTIPIRPTIDAAPGLMADAAAQAAGKSKAIGALAAIVRGHRAGLKTWQGDNDSEIEKYLLSVTRTGDPVIAWDNLTGVLRSPTLATAMIEGRMTGRILGVSEVSTPECRVMWLASGNNCALDRDMATRWLQARIAVTAENPSATAFAFDPVDAALADRHGIARATIIVHRAWHQAGRPRADDINTRFAAWGKTVRQITLWLRDSGLAAEAGIGAIGDPAFAILAGSAALDPESESLSLLLSGLSEVFQDGRQFSAGDVVRQFELGEGGGDDAQQAIHEGLSGLLSSATRRNGKPSTQTVTWVLKNRRDRPCGGRKLVQVTQPTGNGKPALWAVNTAGG